MFSSPEVTKAWVKQHSRWGLLPPQREGAGLALTIVTLTVGIAIVMLIIADVWPAAMPLLIVFGLLNLVSIKRTNDWMRAQSQDPQSDLHLRG